jgi:hypothetical protein
MFLASFHDGSSLGKRIACLATPKLISTTSIMMTKYIISIIWKGGEVEGETKKTQVIECSYGCQQGWKALKEIHFLDC